MKVIINAKTNEIHEEEYTPPKKTKAQEKQDRINEILEELEIIDNKINRVNEDIIEGMHKEFGYMPYETTAEIINHKEDLRDELKALKKT